MNFLTPVIVFSRECKNIKQEDALDSSFVCKRSDVRRRFQKTNGRRVLVDDLDNPEPDIDADPDESHADSVQPLV
jgi:hypothetical protein